MPRSTCASTAMLTEPQRTCIECRFWEFDGGSPGYSEWTPGWGWRSGCMKGVWKLDGEGTSTDEFRRMLEAAAGCDEFEAVRHAD